MAINPSTNATMAGRITAADGNYPYGSSKDETAPGAGDGTPYFKARADDIFGFQQWLLSQAGIVPSGNADNVNNSDYGDALDAIFPRSTKFASVLSSSGYQMMVNGLIIQWASTGTDGASNAVFTFPITFPNAILRDIPYSGGPSGSLVADATSATTSGITYPVKNNAGGPIGAGIGCGLIIVGH